MHTISIAIKGAANDSASVDLSDDQALPLYSKLKDLLSPGPSVTVRPAGRRRVRSAEPDAGGTDTIAAGSGHEDL